MVIWIDLYYLEGLKEKKKNTDFYTLSLYSVKSNRFRNWTYLHIFYLQAYLVLSKYVCIYVYTSTARVYELVGCSASFLFVLFLNKYVSV